jgi:hypothetical protein
MRKRLISREHWKTRRAKAGAAEKWRRDRERRDKLAALSPLQHPGKIVLRVVVIRHESTVKEAIVFDTDSVRDCRRKLREVYL